MSLSSDYSLVDRILHYLAFSHPMVQKVMCEIENDLFGNKFKNLKSTRSIFVTGLPRAGTTLLLNLLYRTGEFTTHTYRHMPFILSPLLWSKISQPFKKEGKFKERAHGDGMTVSFDSPEAFEEIIWLAYLRKNIVHADQLSPLGPRDINTEFADVMQTSIQKLAYLATDPESSSVIPRYLSKNNANISRIEVLTRLFPDTTIVVPFRQPLAHVSSLMKQHERFTAEHGKDRFSKNYMKWLGHYEFGENFKPINFGGWLDNNAVPSQIDQDFWLQYWTAAYRYVISKNNEQIVLVDFDQLLATDKSTLKRIAERLELNNKTTFIQGGEILRAPTTQPISSTNCSEAIRSAAQEIHEQLKALAI